MRALSDTITRLAAFRARQGQSVTSQGADRLSDLPKFGSNPGALRARTHIPQDLPEGAPLVVVLHGCTQTAAGYDHGSGWSRLADQQGFAVLFPEQQRANNANLCFNWFAPGDIRRGAGETLSIRQMVETLVVVHGIDRKRIFVTGLSAGGAMTSVMLAAYPDVFAGGAIIAGLPFGSARTVPEAFDRMRGHGSPAESELQALVRNASKHKGSWPTISVWHGSSDRTVDASNMEAIIGQWRGLHQLEAAPTHTDAGDGYARRVWRGADGRELIEAYGIAGMGHGTPLDTAGEGLGASGPYMLEAGISSTLHIARFWGLAASAGKRADKIKPLGSPGDFVLVDDVHAARAQPEPRASRPRTATPSPRQAPAAKGVGKVIEDALRAAGLMK